jgi:DNA-binding response OmpR family regulator
MIAIEILEMAAKVLIVEDDHATRTGLIQLLKNAGYEVISAATFEQARRLLTDEQPDLLITDVRLEAFNGLQLLMTPRIPLPAIVITGFVDPVLETEAKQLGAEYLVKPFEPTALLKLVQTTLEARPRVKFETARRWVRKQVVGGLQARVDSVRARILDVSYGGLRFEVEIDESPVEIFPPSFTVTLPEEDVAVDVDLVWQSRTRDGVRLCGAALSPSDPVAARAWHGLVDALT